MAAEGHKPYAPQPVRQSQLKDGSWKQPGTIFFHLFIILTTMTQYATGLHAEMFAFTNREAAVD